MKLFESTNIPLLNKALDAYQLRHKVIAANMSNIGTPNYRAKQVIFEEALTAAMQQTGMMPTMTNEHHIPIGGESTGSGSARVIETPAPNSLSDDPLASGINNVDVDHEMTELAKNQLQFKFASRFVSNSFKSLQEAIRGSR